MFARKIESPQEEAFADLESARIYAEEAQRSVIRYRAFLNNLATLNLDGKYLDIGAGPGTLAALIAECNPKVEITALEISEAMITVGEEYIASKGLQDQVKFIPGDVLNKGTVDPLGKFDLIYSTFSLHHWNDPRKVLEHVLPHLKETGSLYIYDLRRVWWLYWIPKRSGFFDSIRAAYVGSEIKELLRGFPEARYQFKNEFPFMHSTIIRNPTKFNRAN